LLESVDEVCDAFEEAWRDERRLAGRPRIEEFLDTLDQRERAVLLAELIPLEIALRRETGENPSLEEYRARFAEMVILPGPTGLPEVLSIPQRYDQVELIGRGGVGIVFRCRDRELGRSLALKVLREEYRDSPDQVERFLREARVCSQLQHPGIVPVHEVGRLADGQPYFTMKLVEGSRLADLLPHGPDPGGVERLRWLRIFEAVCQAVAFAHGKGVCHRDLKPQNIMVGAFQEVQVMDWGMARVRESPAAGAPCAGGADLPDPSGQQTAVADETPVSSVGGGTPAYMPPEQASGQAERLDERADVFGLGAILVEILTGCPPYRGAGLEAVEQAVRGDLGDAFRRLDGCGADPELIGLAKRCLAAERDERPRTAVEVAGAITDYLAGVEARLRAAELEAARATARALVERRLRRVTAGLAAAMLLLGLVGLWWLWQRADLVQAANRDLEKFEESLRAWKLPEARVALGSAEGRVAGGGPAELRQRVRQMRSWMTVVDELDEIRLLAATIVDGHIDYATADRDYAALFFRNRELAVEGEDPGLLAARIRNSPIWAQLVAALDDWANATEDPARQAWLLEVARTADRDDWSDRLRQPAVWSNREKLEQLAQEADVTKLSPQLVVVLGRALRRGGNPVPLLTAAQNRHPKDFWLNLHLGNTLRDAAPAEAVGYYRAALALRQESAVYNNLGHAYVRLGQLDQAIAAYQAALHYNRNDYRSHYLLGVAYAKQKQWGQAIPAYRQALSLREDFTFAHYELGIALEALGQLDEAILAFREAIRCNKKHGDAHNRLGLAYLKKGQPEQAIAVYQQAIDIERTFAPAHNNLGAALEATGKVKEAIASYEEAIRLDKDYARACYNLGNAWLKEKRPDQAIPAYRQALRLEKFFPEAHLNLGTALLEAAEQDEAISEFEEALRGKKELTPAHVQLGRALVQKGKWTEASCFFRRALELAPANPEVHAYLGDVLGRQGQFEAALVAFRRSRELGSQLPGWRSRADRWVRQTEGLLELDRRYTSILEGKVQPANASERIALANLCQFYKQRYRAAADFYSQAFAEQPALAENPKATYRYDAACAAALAGCGQGQDAQTLAELERARWRKQALVWLRATLAWRRQQVQSGQPAAVASARAALTLWQGDPDLARLRDPKALTELPAEEAAEWLKFWAEVRALLHSERMKKS
jgi:serine/threonine-protein kinase